jgi:GT2 family glycosyltransferase
MRPTVDLSIIVASYNTRELLRGCLQSIYDTTQGITFELIVTDDCSSDDTSKMVMECFPQAKLIRNPVNMRYAKSNNNALKAARGRYGLLLDSDTVVQPGAFATLVRFMDEHGDAAVAGPRLVNRDGSVQHCIRSFPGMWPMIFQSLGLHKLFPGNRFTDQYYNTRFDYSRAQPVDSIGTTAFIIRRSTWETYGMLDERFTLAFVDLAYCLMLKLNKQQVYYVPDATVMHYGNLTVNANGLKEIRLLHQALRVFYDCYYAPRHSFLMRAIVHLGIPLRQQVKLLEFRFSKNKQVFGGIAISSSNRD